MSQHFQSNSRICRYYYRFLCEGKAPQFIADVSEQYTLSTLHRLTSSRDPVTRRGAVLAVSFLGGASSVPVVGRGLSDGDRAVRLIASDGIHGLWTRSGSPSQCHRLQQLARLNACGQYEEVIEGCSALLEENAGFAEAWHQRAVAIGSHIGSVAALKDFLSALECDSFHFTSAVAVAECYRELEDSSTALGYFQRALAIYPDQEFARIQVALLERADGERLDR